MSETTGPTWDETLQQFSMRRQMEVRSMYNNAMVSYPDGPPPKVLEQLQQKPSSTYTEFFRGNSVEDLTVIAGQIAPEIQRRTGRAVRIGMVACSGGEETYTLAALLHNENVDATVTGMDVNPTELQSAHEAKYRTFGAMAHVRAINLGVVDLFTYGRDYTEPADAIRSYVNFKQHDILKDPLDGENPFDIITMYNLLYHYSEEARETIINNALAGLTPGGVFAYEGKIDVDLDADYSTWADRAGRKLGLPAKAGAKSGIRTYDPEKRNTPEPQKPFSPPHDITGMNPNKPIPPAQINTATLIGRIFPGEIND